MKRVFATYSGGITELRRYEFCQVLLFSGSHFLGKSQLPWLCLTWNVQTNGPVFISLKLSRCITEREKTCPDIALLQNEGTLCDSNCNIHRPTCPTIHSVPAVNSYQPGADIQMKAAVDLPQQLRLRKSTSTSTSTSSTASKLD